MAGLEGQSINTSHAMALISIAKDIYHVYGNTATLIEKPSGSNYTVLAVYAESGNFRAQLGDTTATIVATPPVAENTDGDGSWKIAANQPVAFTAPAAITVIGDAADAILTYYWL